jgi:ParB/RepB/Spo0J family partition protein
MDLTTISREFKELPLGLIDAPALPSRSEMDEVKLEELTASIRRLGLQQPMVVARVGERFEVIAGHRRRIACGRAGLVAAPCIIYPSQDAALEAIKYAENRHREELNAADEAIWFSELLERDCGGDVDVLCDRIGEKRTYVEGRLLLFQGDELVFERLRKAEIRIGVAQQLNRCSDQQYRRYLLHQAILGGATVAVVSGWIADWENSQRLLSGTSPQVVSTASPGPVPETDYFRCYICGKTHDVHVMRPINVHDYCERAILAPMMAAYRGEPPTSS